MSKILEEVLKEFERIAAIPRPSKHEGTVADYLVDRLKALGASGTFLGRQAAICVASTYGYGLCV